MKIPPKLSWNFTPLYSITKLKSAHHGGLELYLFDALNAPVPSVCQWLVWLLSDRHKHSKVKNPGRYFHPSINHHQPTIREATRGVSEPIWCAESLCDLHLFIAPLVVEIQAKTSKIPLVDLRANFRPKVDQVPTTIRKPLRVVSGPIWTAKGIAKKSWKTMLVGLNINTWKMARHLKTNREREDSASAETYSHFIVTVYWAVSLLWLRLKMIYCS